MQAKNSALVVGLKEHLEDAGDVDLGILCKEGAKGRWREVFGPRAGRELAAAFRRRAAYREPTLALLECMEKLCDKAQRRGFRLVVAHSLPSGSNGEYVLERRQEIHRLRCEEGGAVSAAKVGGLLSVSAVTVASWRRNGRLFGWRGVTPRTRYPVWQVRRGHLLPGLDRCLAALHGADDDAKLAFFLTRTVEDDPTSRPLDFLRTGRIETAIEAASQSKWTISNGATEEDGQLPF